MTRSTAPLAATPVALAAALLDSLVPSGLVRDAGEALLLRPVKLIGPARRGRNFVPLSLKSESEALGAN